MFIRYNPNPQRKSVGDCVVRSISKILDYDWERTYIELAVQGFIMCDMPSANSVWGAYLKNKGFTQHIIPYRRNALYNVSEFAQDYHKGSYILATGSHVVAVVNGCYYDTWDCGEEIPVYYWSKEN